MLNALLSLYHAVTVSESKSGPLKPSQEEDIQCRICGAYCAQLNFVQVN